MNNHLSKIERFTLGFAGSFGTGCAWLTTIALGILMLRLMGINI